MDRRVLWASRLQRVRHDWVHTCTHAIISISLWKSRKMCVFVYICMCINIKFNFSYLSIKTSLYSDCTKTFAYFICITKEKKRNKDNFKGVSCNLKQIHFLWPYHPECAWSCLKKKYIENPCVFFFDNLILFTNVCQIFRKEYGR